MHMRRGPGSKQIGAETLVTIYQMDSVHDVVQARALAATGMVPAAMRWLRHIEILDPANAEAVFATGMLHVHQKAWPEAEQARVSCTATCSSPRYEVSVTWSLFVLFTLSL